MPQTNLDTILERLQTLQAELDSEIDRVLTEKAESFRYTLERGKVRFEAGIKALQHRQKTGIWIYLLEAKLAHVLTAPVIYSLIVPITLLDTGISVYQHICFRVYGIPLVKRSDFLAIDHQYLAYLNSIEKLNCMYCGYANGVIAYSREIAARTEQFWCPIKHARRTRDLHSHTTAFADYGDADGYKQALDKIRADWPAET